MNLLLLIGLFLLQTSVSSYKVSIFGSTGGVGQQICTILRQKENFEVQAISRSKLTDSALPPSLKLLEGCKFMQADARIPDTILPCIEGSNAIVISIGTTAFPTEKWKNGNNPKAACFDTVENILNEVNKLSEKPSTVILVSSIGVERRDEFPFKILNSYKVLDQKYFAEKLLVERANKMGIRSIICRPGRLVGAPFTNFDLAKLFQIKQGDNKGIILDTRDILNGDIERYDVADSITRLLIKSSENALESQKICYSIVNKKGRSPNNLQWEKLLSLFTVLPDQMLTTRES